MIAFLTLQLKEPDEESVLEQLKSMKEVKDAYIVFGEWDIIVKVAVENPEALSTFMIDNIRTIPSVKLSNTLIVAK